MDITDKMLTVAMKKAVEAGLLPRHASPEEMQINRELIRIVLQAGLEAMKDKPVSPPQRYRPSVRSGAVHWRFVPPVEVRSSDLTLFRDAS